MGRTSKDKRDIYYRKAKVLGYRARSAFKLEQLDERFDLFSNCTNIVDLCAAPGSWSQYTARRMRELGRENEAKIVAIDLQEMIPISGVHMLKADITKTSTLDSIRARFFDAEADIVISDGAPDVLGLLDLDQYVQAQLVLAALDVAMQTLRTGGTFVAKVFRQRETDRLYGRLKVYFKDVVVAKPRCSRATSAEAFVVCRQFNPNPGPDAKDVTAELPPHAVISKNGVALFPVKRVIVPFVSAGGIDALDSNMSYPLDIEIPGAPKNPTLESDAPYVSLPPVIPPIEPPYAEAIRRLRLKKQADADTERSVD
eukprot:IDg9111t1